MDKSVGGWRNVRAEESDGCDKDIASGRKRKLSPFTKKIFKRTRQSHRTVKYDKEFQKDEIESNNFLSVIGIELTRGNKTFTNEFLASGGIIKLAIALEKLHVLREPAEQLVPVNEIIIIRCFKEIMDRDEGMIDFLLSANAQRPVTYYVKSPSQMRRTMLFFVR